MFFGRASTSKRRLVTGGVCVCVCSAPTKFKQGIGLCCSGGCSRNYQKLNMKYLIAKLKLLTVPNFILDAN
jgi:hypothetical protein